MKTKAIAMVGALALGVSFMASQVDAWGGYYYRYDHRYPLVKKVHGEKTFLIKSSVWVEHYNNESIIFKVERFSINPDEGDYSPHYHTVQYERDHRDNSVSVTSDDSAPSHIYLGDSKPSDELQQEIWAYEEAEQIAKDIVRNHPSLNRMDTLSSTRNYGFKIFSEQEVDPEKPVFKTKADNGHKMEFSIDENEVLHLYDVKDKKNPKDVLSFIPNEMRLSNTKNNFRYDIKKVYIDNPHKEFFIINAQGDSETVGWWMVGLHRGKWATYMTTGSFNTMGADSNRVRLYHEKAGKYGPYQRNLFFTSQTYSSKNRMRNKEDFAVRAYWDYGARWIGLEYIPLKDFDTYITRS